MRRVVYLFFVGMSAAIFGGDDKCDAENIPGVKVMQPRKNMPGVAVIPGASYFVIHTESGSTLYRASHEKLYPPPHFYKIMIKDAAKQFDWHAALAISGPFVSFHDHDTYLVEDGIRKDPKPFEKIEVWRCMLDQAAKISAYKAVVYTMQHKIKLYDKRNELIMHVGINYTEDMLGSELREAISAYVDHSQIELFEYNTELIDIVHKEDFIQSYKPNNDTSYNLKASRTGRCASLDEEKKCVVM